MPKEGSQLICLSVILNDSVFLKECKYVVKEKKMSKSIIDDIEISCDSDKENTDEKYSDEKFLMKKIRKYFLYFFLYLRMVNKYY